VKITPDLSVSQLDSSKNESFSFFVRKMRVTLVSGAALSFRPFHYSHSMGDVRLHVSLDAQRSD